MTAATPATTTTTATTTATTSVLAHTHLSVSPSGHVTVYIYPASSAPAPPSSSSSSSSFWPPPAPSHPRAGPWYPPPPPPSFAHTRPLPHGSSLSPTTLSRRLAHRMQRLTATNAAASPLLHDDELARLTSSLSSRSALLRPPPPHASAPATAPAHATMPAFDHALNGWSLLSDCVVRPFLQGIAFGLGSFGARFLFFYLITQYTTYYELPTVFTTPPLPDRGAAAAAAATSTTPTTTPNTTTDQPASTPMPSQSR